MDWGINDSLKSRAYGEKKDYASKKDKIEDVIKKGNQYYPIQADGNVDEWSALTKQQA